ncbi:MAG: SDR family oxidoreductase [Nitrospirae bacterium]|nr:SDR family oxidoreductase [Nitrospirota bacterium]
MKTVLITGVAGGIGREIALRFAKEGWNILGHYFSSHEKAGELKKAINRYGVECTLFKADLSSEGEIKRLLKKLQRFEVHSLINNAGAYVTQKHFTDLTVKDIAETFMVNAFAPMMLSFKLFMQMKKRRFGRIVNISSIAAKYGGSSVSVHYGCSKLALEGMTKTLAREGADYNILVNTVRPGVIDTEFHKKFPKDMSERIKMIPLKRMGSPADIAEMVYYLGSDKNSFITNEVIAVAGGE